MTLGQGRLAQVGLARAQGVSAGAAMLKAPTTARRLVWVAEKQPGPRRRYRILPWTDRVKAVALASDGARLAGPSLARYSSRRILARLPCGAWRVGVATADDRRRRLRPTQGVCSSMCGLPSIFHMHIPKTAGTTVNTWLDTLAHVEKCAPTPSTEWQTEMSYGILLEQLRNSRPEDLPIVDDETLYPQRTDLDETQRRLLRLCNIIYSWRYFSIIHRHNSIITERPAHSIVFTILRDPLERAVSQFVDHNSLRKEDYDNYSPDVVRALDTIRRNEFDELVRVYDKTEFVMTKYADAQCRVLLADRYKWRDFYALPPAERASQAIEVLESAYDFVGKQEALSESLRILSSMLGVCPPTALGKLNSRPNSPRLRTVAPVAQRWLEENNQADRVVYDYALRRFERDRTLHGSYDLNAFEEKHAAHRTAEISPMRIGSEFVFDMNMATVGAGLHQREAARSYDCIRWTGPQPKVDIYMPVPAGKALRIRVYNKGWMDWGLRDSLAMEIDGLARAHRFEHPPKMAETFVVDARSSRPWLRITVRIAATKSDGDVGIASSDERKKGFALWGYSYEPLDEGAC
jgi:hypothetical protein